MDIRFEFIDLQYGESLGRIRTGVGSRIRLLPSKTPPILGRFEQPRPVADNRLVYNPLF